MLKLLWSLFRPLLWPILQTLIARLYRPILSRAHRFYLDRREWQSSWEPLDDNLQYKLLLASVSDHNSYLLLHNIGGKSLTEINFSIVARRGQFQFSQPLRVPFLDDGLIERQQLTNIPKQEVWYSKDELSISYESIKLVLHSYNYDKSVSHIGAETPLYRPTYTDYLNGTWRMFQGSLYNIDCIRDLISDWQERLHFKLLAKRGLFGVDATTQWHLIVRTSRYEMLLPYIIYTVFCRPQVIRILCWFYLIVCRLGMRFNPDQPSWWSRV